MSKPAARDDTKKKSGLVALALPLVASLAAMAGGWLGAGILIPAPALAPQAAGDAAVPETAHAAKPAENAPAHGAKEASGHGAKATSGHGDDKGGEAEPVATPIGEVVDLPPIVVNLAPPSKVWARVELSAVFSETPDVEMRRQLHQDILAFMGTVTPAQLEGASGLRHLREDIVDIARVRSEGKARTVLFKTMIFE
jgi:flagellar FliL protein